MAHINHSSHAVHSDHASTTYPLHSNHSNTVTYINRCDSVGTTYSKIDSPLTKVSVWDDLKAKVNDVRSSWGLGNTTFSPSADAQVVASDWNTYVRDKLTESPIPDSSKYSTIVDPATATSNTTPLSTVSYDHGMNSAQSKKCVSICLSVCDPYSTSHSSHNAHSNHTSHGSHSAHTNHRSHDAHSSHSDHDAHSSHSDHDVHIQHGSSLIE